MVSAWRRRITGISRALLSVSAAAAPLTALAEAGKRPWMLEDVVAIPQIEQIVVSEDHRSLAYILRVANTKENRTEFDLHVLSLTDRSDRLLARSAWLHDVQFVPGKNRWSILGDFGAGVQLYDLDDQGRPSPLVVTSSSVLVGSADGAEPGFTFLAPVRVGVASYSWSPDGKRLFYAILQETAPTTAVLSNEAAIQAGSPRRHSPTVSVSFFLKETDHAPIRLAQAPDTDLLARWLGAMPEWNSTWLDYSLQDDFHDIPHVTRHRWRFDGEQVPPLPQQAFRWTGMAWGPSGGRLMVERIGGERRLREHRPDGHVQDYGQTDAVLSDPRSPGSWRAPDGSYSITAVRIPSQGRYALLRLDRSGRTRLIETPESLRTCSFTRDVERGYCIHEGISVPPELVAVNPRSGAVHRVAVLSPRHDSLAPLPVQRRTWRNAFGYKAVGYVVYPPGFIAGGRYPAVIVTHGSDADQRFGAYEFQWNYPVQALAERGYVVVLIADPYSSQSATIEQAQTTWGRCDGLTSPAQMRHLLWLNTLESYRAAIASLAAEKTIDPARVGLAGYSAGSQAVNVAVTQSRLFRAASSGDGGFLEPSGYKNAVCSYQAIFGGPPSDPRYRADYEALSPTYRATFATTPLLQQVADVRPSVTDLYFAYQAAGAPMALTLYPGESPASDETHLFHIPSNRLAAMEENIAWFDFWLRGIEPSAGPDGHRRQQWHALRQMTLAFAGRKTHELLQTRAQLSAAASASSLPAAADARPSPVSAVAGIASRIPPSAKSPAFR